MLGFALLAAWRPAHDDWLNEWSSTPPVSSTMQALRLPVAALELPELLGWFVAVLELGLPHPAMSRLAAPRATTIFTGCGTSISSVVPPQSRREMSASP